MVIFDSDRGRREGQDYSEKRDVSLTLAGRYGARSTRDNLEDSTSSVFYVGAPIGNAKKPIGVLTVYKPQADVLPLVRERRRIIYIACGLIGGGILFLIGAVFLWLFHPIGKITEYARAIERGERPAKPNIGIGREVNTLAHALDSMRDALEGRASLEIVDELDFHAIVAHAIDQARPLAEIADVTLEPAIAAAVIPMCGDAFILQAAVTNLLENAIDFSPRGGTIENEVKTSERNVTLLIRDHGPGVPEYAREKIFERFFSLRHHTSKRKGTGLGRTLVR